MKNKQNIMDTMPKSRSRFIPLTCAVFILVVATLAALWVSNAAEKKSLSNEALRTTQQINEKVTFAIGTLHSMAATHQASPTGFVQNQFEMFAENLVTSQPSLAAAGRYEVLQQEDLDLFKTEIQLQGTFQFEPKTFDQSGNLSPLNQKAQYSTVVAFYPQDPVTANFVGLDFSEIERTRRAIEKSVVRNAPIPAKLPSKWFAAGQLNIFAPTYFGHYIPETVEDRQLQTDGGYFITLDLEQAVKEATSDSFQLSVGVSLGTASNATYIVDQNALIEEPRAASGFFSSRVIKHQLVIGAESATIVYHTPAGITQSQLASATIKGLGALIVFLIAYIIFSIIKASRAQILANEKTLAQERERALVTLNSLQDAVITTDSDDNIDYINPAMQQVLSTSRSEVIGTPLQQLLDANFITEKDEIISDNLHQVNPIIASINSTKRLKHQNGNQLEDKMVFDCHSSAIVGQDNDKIGAVLTMHNISKEHALTTELAHQATHDALTGLPNRRRFENLLENILQGTIVQSRIGHVVGYIDLDQFKLVNDTVGHAAGDELLKKLALDLQSYAPEYIEIARLGGDEFGFITTGSNLPGTREVATSFHEFFQSYFYQAEENIFSIRASIGLTTIKPYHSTINDVLSEVDIACYTAKDAGRNGYVIYDAEDLETKEREGEMLYLPMLQTALKEDRFEMYAQKIISSDANINDTAHHYECLLRLIDEQGNAVTPYKFIVAAERYDLINDIDRWVLKNTFSQITNLRGTALQGTTFSINLSGQSAVDPSMPEFIESMLNQYAIDSSTICFELTETAVISNFSQAQKLIAFLRNRGCTIALDDFGAGASSFGYLKNLEVDYLKIDGQFVVEMTSNKVDLEMVKSMNAVGKALGIRTIAEFVENQETMEALAAINVDYVQGYHIGKPSPLANIINNDQLRAVA